MTLQRLWEEYSAETVFNYSVLPEQVKKQGTCLELDARQVIVSRGEFPHAIYFILEGMVTGVREYADGNEYSYFQLDRHNGSIGLLEILARKDRYIATIVSKTKVKLLRIDAEVIYGAIMEDKSLLRRSLALLAEDLYRRSGNDGIFYYFQGIDKVRYFLTSYYEEHRGKGGNGRITVQAGYQEIASSIGVSVRTVGRNLQKLKEKGEISSSRKKITISELQYRQMLDSLYL